MLLDNKMAEGSCTPSREKYWLELNAEEKVERMRQEVKRSQYRVEQLESKVYTLERLVRSHIHTDGRLYLPAEMGDSPNMSISGKRRFIKPEEEYF